MRRPPASRPSRVALFLVGALSLVVVGLVASTLHRPDPPTFVPTPPRPAEVGARRVGPDTLTVDARDDSAWRWFDFSRGSLVTDPGPREWDLAFRRHEIIVNGGPGMAGDGGARALEGVDFDGLRVAPAGGYRATETGHDTLNPALHRWYRYSLTSHLLTPRPRIYAVRTADGRYAKLEVLGYYCPGAVSGCPTFRYVYQGDGSRALGPAAGGPR